MQILIKAKWGQMIENYLHTSKRLKAVFLLIDIRHEPSENDQMMYEWMVHQGFAPIIIATKSDKLKKMQILQHVQMIKDILQVEPGTIVIPFSAESKQGREEIWQIVESVIELPQGYIEAENAKREAKQKKPAPQEPKKKELWKKTDRPVAKKTLRKEPKKKAKKKEPEEKVFIYCNHALCHSGGRNGTDRMVRQSDTGTDGWTGADGCDFLLSNVYCGGECDRGCRRSASGKFKRAADRLSA